MKYPVRLLREPLFHFFVIGGLLFLLFEAVSTPAPEPLDTIIITTERIKNLETGFQKVWRRAPGEDELSALVDGFVREEIYYREALALGLDRDDTVVRRRLHQKMEFLTNSGADLLEPAPGELEAFLAEHQQTFRLEPRLAFEQLFLGENPAKGYIAAALDALRSDPTGNATAWRERSLLPTERGLSDADAIDNLFGKGFFGQLLKIPSGAWSGPVQSAYGIHLVHIIEREDGRLPELEEISDAVLRDWKSAKTLELHQKLYSRLRQRYKVKMPDHQLSAERSQ